MILALAIPYWATGLLVGGFLVVCVLMMLIILIQRPQGGGLSGAFGAGGGGGAGQTAFGTKTGDALTYATIGMFLLYLAFAIVLNFATRPENIAAHRVPGVQSTDAADLIESGGAVPTDQPSPASDADAGATPAAEGDAAGVVDQAEQAADQIIEDASQALPSGEPAASPAEISPVEPGPGSGSADSGSTEPAPPAH